jgi:hypothetical protein
MQRKQQVGECWVCVIFFARVVVSVLHSGAQGGLGGGKRPREFFFPRETCVIFASFFVLPRFSCPLLGGFSHMVFSDGFLFPVKELGLLTNPGHWVRVLDAVGSYMYIVL